MSRLVLFEMLDSHIPELAAHVADRLVAAKLESYTAFSREQLVISTEWALNAFLRDMREGTNHYFRAHWERVAADRAEHNAAIIDLFQAILFGKDIVDQFVMEHAVEDTELRIWWHQRGHEVIYAGMETLARIFVMVREQVIQRQSVQIRALSTPIVPLYTGVLVLPIVGALNAQRTGQITEALLTGITTHQADVVIIDITGVPLVDTGVAHYLMQAARATRLLGATVVLVGIGAEIAQTIVQLGLELADIVTRANLQSGIEYALARQGLAIQAMPSAQTHTKKRP